MGRFEVIILKPLSQNARPLIPLVSSIENNFLSPDKAEGVVVKNYEWAGETWAKFINEDFRNKKGKGFFQFFVRGITSHANLSPAGIFADGRLQFTLVAEPLFQILYGADVSFCQQLKIRLQRMPVGKDKFMAEEMAWRFLNVCCVCHKKKSA